MGIKKWWNGLSYSEQDWFTCSGLLMLFVVGMLVGIVGVVNIATLEPLVHLGFSVGLVSLLALIFGSMARSA